MSKAAIGSGFLPNDGSRLSSEEVAAIDSLDRMCCVIEGVGPDHFNKTLAGIESPHG